MSISNQPLIGRHKNHTCSGFALVEASVLRTMAIQRMVRGAALASTAIVALVRAGQSCGSAKAVPLVGRRADRGTSSAPTLVLAAEVLEELLRLRTLVE